MPETWAVFGYAVGLFIGWLVWGRLNRVKPAAQVQIPVENLGPEDILVFMSDKAVSEELAARIKQHWEDHFINGKSRCVVLGDGMTFAVIRRTKQQELHKGEIISVVKDAQRRHAL